MFAIEIQFETEREAEKTIECLKKLGDKWVNAEYRVVPITHDWDAAAQPSGTLIITFKHDRGSRNEGDGK